MRVREIMTTDPLVLSHDENLSVAEMLMRCAHVRHLPVVEAGRVVGLITHRDLIRATVEASGDSIAVASIMQRDVKTIDADVNLRTAVRVMMDHKYGCLPVTEKGHLAGIITEADFLKLADRLLREHPEF